MPFFDRLAANTVVARLRPFVSRVRHSSLARRPAVRWGIAVGGTFLMAAAIYLIAITLNPIGVRYLSSGRRFSSEDLAKVGRVLDAQRIEYRIDADQKITVDAEQFDQAAALVAKLNIGPRPIDESREQINSANAWFESPRDREKKEQLAREKIIESMIAKLDGIVWSFVSINRPRPVGWSRVAPRPTAFVYVETDGDRQLPFTSIQSISGFLEGCERDLTMGSITIMDRRGHRYLDPGNPTLNDLSRNRAREEELGQEILRQLDWIKGVRVQVRVIAAAEAKAPVAQGAATGARAAEPSPFTPVVGINRPVELDPEPAPGAPVAVAAITPPVEREHGRVLVNIPRSYYFNAIINKDVRREPSRDELEQMVERTERRVRSHVDLVVAGSGEWDVSVDMITDDIPLSRPPVLNSASDQRRRIVELTVIAVVTAIVSASVVLGSRLQSARRPVRRGQGSETTRRYHADTASTPGPSERVRELIRRNPEAAASVLQRWTGQGGKAV